MAYTFNGTTKRIQLPAGTSLDVRDLYSRWKDWLIESTGSKYSMTFSVVGGDPIDEGEGIYITSYFFLENDWRISPDESSHTLTVENGILLTSSGADPFVPTVGTYNVQIKYSQPIKSETINVAGGGEGGLTDDEHTQLMKTLTLAKYIALK